MKDSKCEGNGLTGLVEVLEEDDVVVPGFLPLLRLRGPVVLLVEDLDLAVAELGVEDLGLGGDLEAVAEFL